MGRGADLRERSAAAPSVAAKGNKVEAAGATPLAAESEKEDDETADRQTDSGRHSDIGSDGSRDAGSQTSNPPAADHDGGVLRGVVGGGGEPGAPVVEEVRGDFGAFEVRKAPPNAPKDLGEMPQKTWGGSWGNAPKLQLPNAPNAPMVSFENTTFARPTGWGKLWRMERNGVYFRYKLRFTDSSGTPQEFRKVTRQGGKISPKIERALAKRPGKGRHEASRVEAGRFRSRAIDLASRIRSSAGRGDSGEFEADRSERGTPALHTDPSLVRGDMPQLPSVDGTSDVPSVPDSDWVM